MGCSHSTKTLTCLLLLLVNAVFESSCVDDASIPIEVTSEIPQHVSGSTASGECLYRPQFIIQPPTAKTPKPPSCNCSRVQQRIDAELQDVKRQLDEVRALFSPQPSNESSVETKVEPKCTTPQLANGLTHSNCSVGVQVRVGTRCRYQCDDGITMQGNDTASCGSDGQWDRPLPKCKVVLERDCTSAMYRGFPSGIYWLQPTDDGALIEVFCDMETDYGGWTVFQRRQDGSVDFFRDFATYKLGFGELDGEFWLGNENLHRLTSQANYELRVDLVDWEGASAYTLYHSFSIGDRGSKYMLKLAGVTGTAGDSLSYHNNMGFSTKDEDNDSTSAHCALDYHGAWWYKSCLKSNLNGWYLDPTKWENSKGVAWFSWKSSEYSMKKAEMKFRLIGLK